MENVRLLIHYRGKNYLTNVIVEKGTPEKQILRIAKSQIKKQKIKIKKAI
ncbi:BA3454 family stress response protein [Neobacillus cucumis]|nr:BA3454 family stress response protein [Neobacillus cucumis]MDR4947687.1 BA3454 family stress response protein [Neobacillus cucumis]